MYGDLKNYFCIAFWVKARGVSRISCRGGAKLEGAHVHFFNFLKNPMNLKKFWSVGGDPS